MWKNRLQGKSIKNILQKTILTYLSTIGGRFR